MSSNELQTKAQVQTQSSAASSPPPLRTAGPWREYFRKRLDPLTSLVFTLPVFVFYHIGILLVDQRTGVDLVSDLTLRLIEHSTSGYIIVVLAISAVISATLWILQKSQRIVPIAFAPALIESAMWAIALFGLVGWTAQYVGGITGKIPALNLFEAFIMAAGAGFHEEVLFRVIGFYGLAFLLSRSGTKPWVAWLIAGVISSIAYGFTHTLGLDAEPFSLQGLLFRVVTGVCLANIFYFRGFAIAVYAHVFYDLVSMLGNMDRGLG